MLEYTFFGALLALITTLPLAWKWELGVYRVAVGVVLLALLSGLIVTAIRTFASLNPLVAIVIVWFLTVTLAVAVLAYRFYRDPERRGIDRDDVIASPADGTVIYVRESHRGVLPVTTKHGINYGLHELTKTRLLSEDAVVIGIAMNFLDVHVNRSPISGRVTLQRHFPGRFGSLKLAEMVFENERATTVIEHHDLQVAIVQIASRLVRQIVSFVHEGEDVTLGQRIGVIRLGSQVDLVLPKRDDLKIAVQVGERVIAGESVVATIETTGVPVDQAGKSALVSGSSPGPADSH